MCVWKRKRGKGSEQAWEGGREREGKREYMKSSGDTQRVHGGKEGGKVRRNVDKRGGLGESRLTLRFAVRTCGMWLGLVVWMV